MKRILIGLAIAGAMFVSCCSNGQVIKLDPKATVRVTGVITSAILPKGKELIDMAAKNKEVTLLINSPGGQVIPGFMFIDDMELVKSRGVKIRCVVPNLAASMAFHILAHCDSRYSLNSAVLLWHPAKMGCFMCSLTAEEMIYQGTELMALEEPQNQALIEALGVSPDFYFYHYKHETVWLGYVLSSELPNFISTVTDIQGIDDFQSMDSDVEGYLNNLLERTAKDF
jgi:ATP-dependent protease ClpP protease subunit